MVFDVPADSGGALTILNQYYNTAVEEKDKEWIFVIGIPKLEECENITVLNYPWVKKSWFHRLYFDLFIAYKIVNKYKADEILCLQNVIIPRVSLKQTLYLHQSLPFIEKKYGITENFKFWLYQNIVGKIIYKSIQKSEKIIVQTKWMMEAAIKKTGVCEDKFILKQPELNFKKIKPYEEKNHGTRLFFYPANGLVYKNHKIIVKACKILKNQGIDNYKVIFTLTGEENKHIKNLRKTVNNYQLPIDFIGSISIDEVYNYYSKSVLIFPSYIETFGLPLLEAKMHNSQILASNCKFSVEILDNYQKVEYFDPDDTKELSGLMKNRINNLRK